MTTATVSPTLSTELSRSRATAYAKYASLLTELIEATHAARPDRPPARQLTPDPAAADPKLLAQLRTAATALGRTPAKVEADALVLSRLRAARAKVASARGSTRAQAEAKAAVQAHDVQTKELLAERKREYFRLYGVHERIGICRRAASDAVREINALIEQNPELLSAEKPAQQEDMR